MMNSSCMSSCILDIVNDTPLMEQRTTRLYQWAQSDKEFLRLLSTAKRSPPPPEVMSRPYSCSRQTYLRSYTFSCEKKDSGKITLKWLKQKSHSLMMKKSKKKDDQIQGDGYCSIIDAFFKILLTCVAKA